MILLTKLLKVIRMLIHCVILIEVTNTQVVLFHAKLEAAGITQSMSRVAKCIDNGPMEGFWGIPKERTLLRQKFTDRESLITMIEDYIEYYNTKRLQRNLGVLTPFEKHEQYMLAA